METSANSVPADISEEGEFSKIFGKQLCKSGNMCLKRQTSLSFDNRIAF